jgi:hypothetical protein
MGSGLIFRSALRSGVESLGAGAGGRTAPGLSKFG